MRIFLVILFMLATLPMIMGGFIQLSAGAMMYSATRNVQSQILASGTRGEPYKDSLDVEGHLLRKSHPAKGYLALLNANEMDDLRSIRVRQNLPLNAFLENGESKPADEFIHILLSSRARKVAERECRILKQSLADKCSVRSAEARMDKRGRHVTLRARYDFTQKNGIGTFEADLPLRYVAVKENFRRKGSVSESARASVYRKISDMCKSLRSREGNCGLSSVSVTPLDKKKGLSVKATLSALQRRS